MFKIEIKSKEQIARERADRQREAMQEAIRRQEDMVENVGRRADALEAANDDMILLMAELIGGN